MASVAPEIAKASATSLMGTAVSSVADKSTDQVQKESSVPVKVGIKFSEVILSTLVSTSAIVAFDRLPKKFLGKLPFIFVALIVSVICAIIVAYVKTVM